MKKIFLMITFSILLLIANGQVTIKTDDLNNEFERIVKSYISASNLINDTTSFYMYIEKHKKLEVFDELSNKYQKLTNYFSNLNNTDSVILKSDYKMLDNSRYGKLYFFTLEFDKIIYQKGGFDGILKINSVSEIIIQAELNDSKTEYKISILGISNRIKDKKNDNKTVFDNLSFGLSDTYIRKLNFSGQEFKSNSFNLVNVFITSEFGINNSNLRFLKFGVGINKSIFTLGNAEIPYDSFPSFYKDDYEFKNLSGLNADLYARVSIIKLVDVLKKKKISENKNELYLLIGSSFYNYVLKNKKDGVVPVISNFSLFGGAGIETHLSTNIASHYYGFLEWNFNTTKNTHILTTDKEFNHILKLGLRIYFETY